MHFDSSNLLLSKPNPGATSANIMHSKNALKENISKDTETNTSITLNSTEALPARVVNRSVIDQATRNSEHLAADFDVEVGESGAAGEDITTLAGRVCRPGDFGVVGRDDGSWEVEERGTGVSNGSADGSGSGGAGTDGVAACNELPESVGGVHIRVGD